MAYEKPLLIFDGNCQAQHLSAMILSTGIADTIHVGGDWGFIPAHRGFISRMVTQEQEPQVLQAAKARGQRLIQVTQATPRSRVFARGEIDIVDTRVTFPEVRFWATSQRRFEEKFKTHTDLERILELDLSSMRRSQEKSGFPIDVGGFIQREVVNRPLFHTVNHPCGAVFSRLLEGLAVLLGDELDASALLALAKEVEFREGLNFETDHPVPAAVRDRLGLKWGPNYEIYATMILARRKKEWADLERDRDKYAELFSNDTQYWRAYAFLGAAQKDASIAVPAFERMLELCPGVAGPWQHYIQFLHGTGQAADISALLARAEKFFGDSSILYNIATRAYLTLRRFAEAEHQARKYWSRSQENMNAVIPLIQSLILQQRIDEASSIVKSLRSRTPHQLNMLRNLLGRLDQGPTLIAALDSQD